MGALSLRGITKRFGKHPVLQGIDLQVSEGSILALLGPSGCGKTTLLRLIAGFEAPDHGQITLQGRNVASPSVFVPPPLRGIGYVPQEGALFPHLSVEGNVRFGLTQGPRSQRIADVLALIGLDGFRQHRPHQLSGGQQQRIALARALARDPSLVLLDEPFNALDLGLRRSLCQDVVSILRQTGRTAILVTHDPAEAFAVADQIAVMQQGRILQRAEPQTVYWQPAQPSVASLTGAALLLPGQAQPGAVRCALGELALLPSCAGLQGPATVLVRPEQVQWHTDGAGPQARVIRRDFRGDHLLVGLALEDSQLSLRMPTLAAPPIDAVVRLRVQGRCMAYPDD